LASKPFSSFSFLRSCRRDQHASSEKNVREEALSIIDLSDNHLCPKGVRAERIQDISLLLHVCWLQPEQIVNYFYLYSCNQNMPAAPCRQEFVSVGVNRVVNALSWSEDGTMAYGAHHMAAIYDPQVCVCTTKFAVDGAAREMR